MYICVYLSLSIYMGYPSVCDKHTPFTQAFALESDSRNSSPA